MYLRKWPWLQIYLEGEGNSGGGAADAGDKGADAGGGDKGQDGDTQGGGQGDKPAALSLRASVAQTMEGDERADFEKWANQYNDDASFAKSMASMRRQFDARVPVPGQDAKPDDYAKYMQRVGMPKDPKEYTYDFGKDAEGKPVQLDDTETARFEGFKEYAHKNHFTQAQFKAALDFLHEDQAKSETEFTGRIEAAHKKSVDELREEWGPDFENNVNAAVDGGILYAESEDAWRTFVNLPLQNGMLVGDHPTFLRTMSKIGRATSEDQRVRQMNQNGEAESVKAEIAKLEQEALDAGELPSDPKWHARIEPLYKKLYPKKYTAGQGSAGFGAR